MLRGSVSVLMATSVTSAVNVSRRGDLHKPGSFYFVLSACNCCKDGTDDGSFTCDASGNCGLCGVGFFGDKCCGSTYSLFPQLNTEHSV